MCVSDTNQNFGEKCRLIPVLGQNPRWPPKPIGGAANFAPIALRSKILVANIGFSRSRNRLEQLSTTPEH